MPKPPKPHPDKETLSKIFTYKDGNLYWKGRGRNGRKRSGNAKKGWIHRVNRTWMEII